MALLGRRRLPRARARFEGTATLPVSKLPSAALPGFLRRVVFGVVLVIILLVCAIFKIARREGNLLLTIALTCSLASLVAAAFAPQDSRGPVSRAFVIAGLCYWWALSLALALNEWAPRPYEADHRTAMRRTVVTANVLLVAGLVVAYTTRRCTSSWDAIRAAFFLSAMCDLIHTAVIHMLYIIYPASQPTQPIAYTSGVRVGPPGLSSYLAPVYTIGFSFAMNANVRERISQWSGAARLSIGLSQLRSGELAEMLKESVKGGSTILDEALALSQPGLPRGDSRQARAVPAQRCCSPKSSSQSSSTGRGAAAADAAHRSESFRSRSERSSAASELARYVATSHAVASAVDGAAAVAPPAVLLPSYRLLPAFYGERVTQLTSQRERTDLVCRVVQGKLVDSDGCLLSPEKVGIALYAMEPSGNLLLALDWQGDGDGAPQKLYHSSLVGGGAVAAAGLMHICSGRLRLLSNESGHYAPPPSTLRLVLARLVALGLEGIAEVQLEAVCTTLTQSEALPASANRRAESSCALD